MKRTIWQFVIRLVQATRARTRRAAQECEQKSREVDLQIVRLDERVSRVERDSGIVPPQRRATAS